MIDLKELIKSGVHFGHQTSRWCPKMSPYIWGAKNGIHLINVSETARQAEKAAQFLESVAADGKSILLVGTKKAAQDIIERLANELTIPYVRFRWVGGTFSNYRQVLKARQKLLHLEDVLSKSEELHYTKKELNMFQKQLERLKKNVGGLRNLTWPVGAVVIVDVKKEHVCVKEAIAMQIPIVALVDTNCDPSHIDYVIPANDDVPRSIDVLMSYLGQAIQKGQAVAAARPQDASSDAYEPVMEGVNLEEEEEERTKKRRAAHARAKKAQATARPTKPVRRPEVQKNESEVAKEETSE